MIGVAVRATGLDSRLTGCAHWPLEGWGMNPDPDYDATDEIEYFFSWLPWALRGVYPPPAYPPV